MMDSYDLMNKYGDYVFMGFTVLFVLVILPLLVIALPFAALGWVLTKLSDYFDWNL